MNVVILSASRKVWLVRAFQQAVSVCGGGRVLALDTDPLAAALAVADTGSISPPSNAAHFGRWLVDLCRRESVGLVVPTRDEELDALAVLAAELRSVGALAAVSPAPAIAICQDKRRFAQFCLVNGFATPCEIANPDDPAAFPAFVKPRKGKAGRDAARIETIEALRARGFDPARDILQEWVVDPEFTIDVFTDLDGRVLSAVPRERLRVVAGESVVARTVSDRPLEHESARIVAALGLQGHVTVQAFRGTDRIRFIEVNPRYGGGAALGFAAGCPTPEWLVRLAAGESVAPRMGCFTAGLWMFRHSTDVFLPEEAVPEFGRKETIIVNHGGSPDAHRAV